MDRASFADLVMSERYALHQHARVLTRNSIDAEDLFHDCVTRAFAKQHLFQEGTNIRAWLHTILFHLFSSQIRQENKHRRYMTELTPSIEKAQGALSQTMPHLIVQDVERLLDQMQPEWSKLVILSIDHNYTEMAKIEGVPVGTVRSRLSRARQELRRLVDGDDS